jgi:hypothetical protein
LSKDAAGRLCTPFFAEKGFRMVSFMPTDHDGYIQVDVEGKTRFSAVDPLGFRMDIQGDTRPVVMAEGGGRKIMNRMPAVRRYLRHVETVEVLC